MIVTTSPTVAGHRVVKTLGIVRGNTVRVRHLGHLLHEDGHCVCRW